MYDKLTSLFFGRTKNFAVELQNCKRDNYKLRLWFNEKPIGYFKKCDTLIYAAICLKRLLLIKEELMDEFIATNQERPEEIYRWIVWIWDTDGFEIDANTLRNVNLNKLEEAKFKQKYIRLFGVQLMGFDLVSYFNDNSHIWIVFETKKKTVEQYIVKDSEVVNVANDFLSWYETTFGEVKVNLSSLH